MKRHQVYYYNFITHSISVLNKESLPHSQKSKTEVLIRATLFKDSTQLHTQSIQL